MSWNLIKFFLFYLGSVVTYKDARDYKQAQAFTLAQDYGFTRIMSSFDFSNTDQGPPSGANGA